MNKPINKPPLGLIPKEIHYKNVTTNRFIEVCLAISRYYDAGLQIKIEWIKEYNELVQLDVIKKLNNYEQTN
jgi:hypothetical protein